MKAGKIFIEDRMVNIEIMRDGKVIDVYTIPLSECDTGYGLCNWIRQIGEKIWTDKDSLLRFVRCVMVGLSR